MDVNLDRDQRRLDAGDGRAENRREHAG
jgi:hypothetical protein